MEIMQETPTTFDMHFNNNFSKQYTTSSPRTWVIFTHAEYQYVDYLLRTIHTNWNNYASIYEAKDNLIRVPLKLITDNLRLLTLADHANPNKQEGLMLTLRDLLDKVNT